MIGVTCPKPSCAEQLAGTEEVCPECGTKVYPVNSCSICGREFKQGASHWRDVCGDRDCVNARERWRRRERKAAAA